jgi:hypothetical protein
MNEAELEICINITSELLNSNLGFFFDQPYSDENSDYEDYIRKVTNPQDLGTILQKLKDKEFKTVNEWKQNVNLVWENNKMFYGDDSLYSDACDHLEKMFKKRLVQFEMRHFNTWVDRMNQLFSKFDDLLGQSPAKLKKTFRNLKPSEDVQKADLEIFQQKSKTLKSVNHRMKLLQILSSFGNPIDHFQSKIVVDLDSISNETANALVQYQKEVQVKSRERKLK